MRNSWGTGGGDVNDGYGGYFYMTQDPATGFFNDPYGGEAAIISSVTAPVKTIRLSTNTGWSEYPSVAASGSYVYVAWDDNTPVTGSGTAPEIWMRVSAQQWCLVRFSHTNKHKHRHVAGPVRRGCWELRLRCLVGYNARHWERHRPRDLDARKQ